ncbi:MAG TPA: hypothetical protein VGQ51_09830 [Puia sp.]|jgi:hypothetical protein|nr:hypothetical protein [Puia sp.]
MVPDTNGRAYTMPEISTANPKDWYIWFRYTHNDKEVPRKFQGIKPTAFRKDIFQVDGLNFALEKKKLASQLKPGYKSMLDFIKQVAVKEGYNLLPLTEFDRGVCLNLIDECAKVRQFTNHNYNKHVAVLRSMFGELVQYRMLKSNPLTGFREKEEAEQV